MDVSLMLLVFIVLIMMLPAMGVCVFRHPQRLLMAYPPPSGWGSCPSPLGALALDPRSDHVQIAALGHQDRDLLAAHDARPLCPTQPCCRWGHTKKEVCNG